MFNCFKSAECDRQIGDRRLPNAMERAIDGPSRQLPSGFLLTNLRVTPFKQQLFGSITDRRDFYHQAKVTPQRAASNVLPFCYSYDDLKDTSALVAYLESKKKTRAAKGRTQIGDGFGSSSILVEEEKQGFVFPCFSSLFQGDHLGVEYALQAHEACLQYGGSLIDRNRVKGHSVFPLTDVWEGLIIDDYFVISAEDFNTSPTDTRAFEYLEVARETYDKQNLMGSQEKDIVAQNTFKAAGAEIISSDFAVKRGLTLVGAPLQKRISLAALSLRAARLAFSTSSLLQRLAGSWTSVLLYRRCTMAVIDDLFKDAAEAERQDHKTTVPLSRKVAQELSILAVLAPIAVSNVAVEYSSKIYASDASLGKGAVCSTNIDPAVSEVIWLGSDKRGCYTHLDGAATALLAAAGEEPYDTSCQVFQEAENPRKSPLLYFAFVEFYGGSGRISACLVEGGFQVAPPLDLSASEHYNMTNVRLLEWCLHMIETARFESFMSEPPCTSFSPAAHPAVRSYALPEGFVRTCPKTLDGNTHAFRSFVLLRHGRRFGRPCGKEQPRLSKMAWLKAWRSLLADGFRESVVASCQFGSIHRKEFRILSYLLDHVALEVKCPGGHEHVPIAGAYTKPSAVYTWDLAKHFAMHFEKAILAARRKNVDDVSTAGYESPVCNDLLSSSKWTCRSVWAWKQKSHINVLEANGGVAILCLAAKESADTRFNCLLDSRVAKGALAKGRSSSKALQGSCKRAVALQIAAGLYPGWGFAPTRLNVTDDPTRNVALRDPTMHSFGIHLQPSELQVLHAGGFSRWAANWIRLVLLATCIWANDAHSPSQDVSGAYSVDGETWLDFQWIFFWICNHLGGFWTYPGADLSCHHVSNCCAGPVGFWICQVSITHFIDSFSLWNFFHCLAFLVLAPCLILGGFLCLWSVVRFSPVRWILLWTFVYSPIRAMEPVSALETQRAAARGGTCPIPTRVERQKTLEYRSQLLDAFRAWLYDQHGVILQ